MSQKEVHRRLTSRTFEDMVHSAMMRSFFAACPDEVKVARALSEGKPIPDKCKPGALLDELDDEDRKAIGRLKSDMIDSPRTFFDPREKYAKA
jgi:hypothetical protein